MKRSFLVMFGFLVARWIFGRKPVLVPVMSRVDRCDDPVSRLRRFGAL